VPSLVLLNFTFQTPSTQSGINFKFILYSSSTTLHHQSSFFSSLKNQMDSASTDSTLSQEALSARLSDCKSGRDEANCSKLQLTILSPTINIDSLHKLNLSNNNLDNSCMFLFSDLCGLPNLTLLNISSNKLAGLINPPKNPKLLVLNLSKNEITGFSNPFPPQLKALVVTNNKLTEVPTGLPSDLTDLILSHNEITELKLEGLPSQLERISLAHNKIEALPLDFSGLEYCKNISVNGNNLKKLPNQFPKYLEILDYGNNSLLNVCASLFDGLSLAYLANVNFKGTFSSIKSYEKEIPRMRTIIQLRLLSKCHGFEF
jgi:hypothetical protein